LAVLVVADALSTARAQLPAHGGPIRGIAISADGTRALTAGFDYSIIEWDMATVRPVRRLIGHDAAVNAVVYLPGGRAASASDDGTVAFWNLADGTRIRSLIGHGAKVTAIAVSPDGSSVASAAWDGTARLWTSDRGAELRRLEHQANVNVIAFSPDGTQLASAGSDGRVIVWNVADGARLREFGSSGFPIIALSFTADGRSLLAASTDMTVRQWDPATGRENAAPQRYDAPILALSVSAEGVAAAGDLHGGVRLWRPGELASLRQMAGGGEPVWAIGLTSNGERLVTGAGDGVLRVWEVRTGQLLGPEIDVASNTDVTAGDAEGARLFRKCAICHSITADGGGRAGPTLYRIFGRRAGSVADYPYSGALRESDVVWTEATLDDLFEHGPDQMTPGSKMPLQRIPNARERAELIAYLKRITAP
jgi:cytochrome c